MFKLLIATAIGLFCLFFLVMAVASLGGGIDGGQGEATAPGATTEIGVSTGSRWRVDKLPPEWNGSDSVHGKWYTPEAFGELRRVMQEVVDQYKLPADEFMALINLESSGNPYALGPILRGGDRAVGLGQFTIGTARGYSEFGDAAEQRPANRTNPISALRAAARKLAFDRNNNFGEDWGTLRPAYLGPQPRPANGKGRNGHAWTAYNAGESNTTYDQQVVAKGKEYEAKGYVVRLNPAASSAVATSGTISSGVLGADNLYKISQTYLGVKYGGEAELVDQITPRCLNCQTFVETVMIQALKDQLGGFTRARTYIMNGAEGKSRIVTPIPGWIYPANAWPAREATREVAESSGIGDSVKIAHWFDYSGGHGDVDIAYIPWNKVAELKGNDTINGTLIAYISSKLSNGVTHVGFLFNNGGKVLLRHATKPQVMDVDLAERVRILGPNFYTGIIILRPDASKLRP